MKENEVKEVIIDWKPDKELNIPIYRQIVKYISDKIAKGIGLLAVSCRLSEKCQIFLV